MSPRTWALCLCAALAGVGLGRIALRTLPEQPGGGRERSASGPAAAASVERRKEPALTAGSTAREIAHWMQQRRPGLRQLEHWPAIAQLPPGELVTLAELLWPEAKPHDETLRFVLSRLVLHDPVRALNLSAQRDRYGVRRKNTLTGVMMAVAQVHPAAGSAWVAGRDRAERRALQRQWLFAFEAVDPLGAWHWARTQTWQNKEDLRRLAGRLPKERAAETLEEALQLPQASLRSVVIDELLETWAGHHPATAAAWLQAHPRLRAAQQHWLTVLRNYVDKDPRAAVELAAAGTSGEDGHEQLSMVLSRWAHKDPVAARNWLAASALPRQEELFLRNLSLFVSADPAAAIELAAQAAVGPKDQDDLQNALTHWLMKDLSAARAWILALPPGAARERVVQAWLEAEVLTTPDEIRSKLDLLRELRGGADQSDTTAAHAALTALAKLDLDAALAWVNQDPSPERRRSLLRMAIHGGSVHSPERAVNLLREWARDPDESLPWLTGAVAAAWAARSPVEAARWAQSLPHSTTQETDARESAFRQIAEVWSMRDRGAALRWAGGLPGSAGIGAGMTILMTWPKESSGSALEIVQQLPAERRDALLGIAIVQHAEQHPVEAAAWAERLPLENRGDVLLQIARGWLALDPVAARIWIDTKRAEMPAEELERLLPGH